MPRTVAAQAAAADACDCPALLDSLASRVEVTYPGYLLEVRGHPNERTYRAFRDSIRTAAGQVTARLDCVALLQDYVAWFRDGHLFVGGRPPVRTAADSARLRAAAPTVAWREAEVRGYLASHAGSLDPVEGIWRDPAGLFVAIVRESSLGDSLQWDRLELRSARTARSGLVAFVLASTASEWEPGDVKARLTPLPDGSYDGVLLDDVRAATHPHVYTPGLTGGARLQRDGMLLHMPPTTWGKLYPLEPGRAGEVDPMDPRAPTARRIGGAVVVHVPSHVPSHAATLHALVEQYRSELERADALVIDLRGNEGGSAFVTNVFLPFLGPEARSARYYDGGHSVVVASPDNVAYFERAQWAPKGLVARLRAAAPGTVVPFADEASVETTPEDPPAARGPDRVAIVVDRMTVSAAEAFVLKAMRREKVTVYGEPTGNSIDYQTVSIVRFGCPAAGLYLGYPTIVGSHLLPEGGVRPTGIVPDERLDMTGDPVGDLARRLNALE